MRYVIGSDHAGLVLKNQVVEQLRARDIDVEDLGTHTTSSVDYPDLAGEVARTVSRGDAAFGILICGSGIGVSIAANKVRGVRAAVCRTEYEARMARLHNDANVLCMGERVTGAGLAEVVVEAWLSTDFEGGRHQRRVDKIQALEEENQA